MFGRLDSTVFTDALEITVDNCRLVGIATFQ